MRKHEEMFNVRVGGMQRLFTEKFKSVFRQANGLRWILGIRS